MKKHINHVKALAGITALTILTTGVVGGCSKTEETSAEETATSEIAEETTEENTTEATTAETTEETTTEETTTEPPEYWMDGQEEYMRPRTAEWGTDLHFIYDDLSEIADDETRELAQAYADKGYTVYDPVGVDRYGDDDFEFSTGFGCECIDEKGWNHIIVWKMNEALFEYYILNMAVWWEDYEGDILDDGTVLTYSLYVPSSGYSANFEFNRDTGFMTFWEIEPREEYWPLIVDDIEDPNLYEVALECIDNGFVLEPADTADMYEDMSENGDVGEQFCYYDSMTFVEYTVMDKDVFDVISGPNWCNVGGGHETEEDGHVVTITYYNPDGTMSSRYQYDGDTGICRAEQFIYW